MGGGRGQWVPTLETNDRGTTTYTRDTRGTRYTTEFSVVGCGLCHRSCINHESSINLLTCLLTYSLLRLWGPIRGGTPGSW